METKPNYCTALLDRAQAETDKNSSKPEIATA
jgi:hypothetical protein